MLVSGKILRKKVTPGQWGSSIMFVVLDHGQERMVSCFDNKLSDEAKNILQALVEGMYCDFEVIESPSKKGDGKIYLNITSATPITQLRDEVPSVPPAVQPSGLAAPAGQAGTPKEGDTKIRSMALAYAKDWGVATRDPEVDNYPTTEKIIEWAKRFEQYILTGE